VAQKHILIIDDDTGVRMLLRKLLESTGYRVSEAKNALEVFSIDLKNPPDLFILDINMPGISGHQVLTSFKNDPGFHSPVIVLSGLSDPEVARTAIAEGADAFLLKPANRETLLAKIAELLSR
jgi:two-component system chemotaxis response regulator CheY